MFARTSAVILGMVGAFALGLTLGPQINANRPAAAAPEVVVRPDVARELPARVTPATGGAVALNVRAEAPRLERVLPASARPVQQHMKRLLNDGADVEAAAEGFHNARELMTVAYAARNTDIPFVLLKHRVLTEQMSLARAIGASRPELDAAAEVNRARAEAKADLARISS
ncbi:MAG: hypothetical protein KA371_04445 [Acidobacteria bacterium]|nr:hypothetical protein [Acidobacteriota bacterium]